MLFVFKKKEKEKKNLVLNWSIFISHIELKIVCMKIQSNPKNYNILAIIKMIDQENLINNIFFIIFNFGIM